MQLLLRSWIEKYNMKHTQKVSLARKMAKRGDSNIFMSKSWLNRKEQRATKELAK
jgi:hypothetical protein